MARALRLAVLAAGLAVGAFSLAVARGSPGYSFGGGSTGAAELVAGYALLAVGVAALGRREARVGALLVAALVAWFLPEWNNPGARSALVFTVGLALCVATPPLVAHAVLAHPGGRLPGWPEGATVAAAYGAPSASSAWSPPTSSTPLRKGACSARATSCSWTGARARMPTSTGSASPRPRACAAHRAAGDRRARAREPCAPPGGGPALIAGPRTSASSRPSSQHHARLPRQRFARPASLAGPGSRPMRAGARPSRASGCAPAGPDPSSRASFDFVPLLGAGRSVGMSALTAADQAHRAAADGSQDGVPECPLQEIEQDVDQGVQE
jgi:hypothetical protein